MVMNKLVFVQVRPFIDTALLIIGLWIYLQVGAKFLKEKGFKHVSFLAGDGALESYPAVRLLSFYLFSFLI